MILIVFSWQFMNVFLSPRVSRASFSWLFFYLFVHISCFRSSPPTLVIICSHLRLVNLASLCIYTHPVNSVLSLLKLLFLKHKFPALISVKQTFDLQPALSVYLIKNWFGLMILTVSFVKEKEKNNFWWFWRKLKFTCTFWKADASFVSLKCSLNWTFS